MRDVMAALGVVALAASIASAQGAGPTDQDRAAVRQAAYDYAEGFYLGAGERMARAVHPAIIKRGVVSRPGFGSLLAPMNAETLVEATGQNASRPTPADQQNLSFGLLDIRDNVASAKIFTRGFNDYLHLVKQNGQWRLAHVLWQPPVPDGAANAEADKAAVAQAVNSFVEALAAGDAARLERLTHPEAALRGFRAAPRSERYFLVEGNRDAVLAAVAAKSAQTPRNPTVTVLDVYDTIASVLLTSQDGISYWHLAKQNGQWRVVNRLTR